MEQALYMVGVVISGIITGLSVYAAKGGDTPQQRKQKMMKKTGNKSQTDEIVAASIATTHLAISTQSGMWSRIEALEAEQGKQAKEMVELRKQNIEKDKKIQEQQQEIDSLTRKVELLREKLNQQGIEITEEELEKLL